MKRYITHPLAILAAYSLLTLILTYPLTFNLTTTVPNDIGDPLLNTWILAWDVHAMLTHPLKLFEANIFYPLPHTLAYSEHLFSTAMLALPLQIYTHEPLLAYNLSLLISFPLAAFGMYLLTLHWTHHRQAAFIAGFIFAFAPYRFAAIAHLQLLTFHWLPFMLLCLSHLTESKPLGLFYSPSRLFAVLIFGLLQILACWYLAVYLLVIQLISLLAFSVQLVRRSTNQADKLNPDKLISDKLTSFFANWLIALALTFMLTLPWAYPYLQLMPILRQSRPLATALTLAAQPTDFIAAAPFNQLFGRLTAPFRQRADFTEENTLFLGFIAPLLASLTLLKFTRKGKTPPSPRGMFCSLSPWDRAGVRGFYPLWAILLLTLALTFAWPYATLAQLIPASTVIRVPPRWIIPALFALSGLAGFGYKIITQKINPRWQPFIFIGIISSLFAETFSAPIPLATVDNHTTLNPAYHWLAKQPHDFALLELPMYRSPEYPEVKRLYASTLGWWPLVNGYSGYTPPRQPALAEAMSTFPAETALTALLPLIMQESHPYPPPTPPDIRGGVKSPPLPLNEGNIGGIKGSRLLYILVHPGELDRSQWENALRWQAEQDPRLKPLGQFTGDYLYEFIPPNPARFAQPPLARFVNGLELLSYQFTTLPPDSPHLMLYWRATQPLTQNLTVFIHLRATDGFVRGQADGLPVSGHAPMNTWQVGQVVQDIHLIPLLGYDHLAVGLYNPTTNSRLTATSAQGEPLSDDLLIIKR